MVTALRGVLEAGSVDRVGIRQISVDIKVTHQDEAASTTVNFNRNFGQ